MTDPEVLAMSAAEQLRLRPTWYEVDLDAVAHNYRELRRLVGPDVRIYPALKQRDGGPPRLCRAG
jgi:alanine racemase